MALSSNPYGENDLFKDFKSRNFTNDAYKSTNPMAQKAFLDSNNTFKISPNPVLKVRVRPFNAVISKKSLFDGLEENDPSLEGNFAIKSNPKRLIIKPHNKASVNESITNSQGHASKFVACEKENTFSGEIFTTSMPPINLMDEDTDRRVSWLRTAAPQKLSRPKFHESAAENTIEQMGNQTVQSEFDTNDDLEEGRLQILILIILFKCLFFKKVTLIFQLLVINQHEMIPSVKAPIMNLTYQLGHQFILLASF